MTEDLSLAHANRIADYLNELDSNEVVLSEETRTASWDNNRTYTVDQIFTFDEVKYAGSEEKFPLPNGWVVQHVADEGGEGQGDGYWVVFSVTDGKTTRLFRKDGWYASYEGGFLDGPLREVSPVKKMVTFYE